ncbi:phage tail assembly chaperone [Pseudomonas koreensis]|uniref:Phage tail assembly chaperone n=1 Tax=Pseudomonas koreensis TaxID=198620 RepID=A0A9X3BEW9_9PSED|nr:phage tail assembly chaperone [Pseudomonas koreensis]MCU7250788.1 phage tail assembly chaperone [Pseudomonas koreensis]
MARYARIENGVAVELIDTGDFDIAQLYAPSFVEAMVLVPEGIEVEIGSPLGDLQRRAEPAPVLETPVLTQATSIMNDEPARTWRESRLSGTQWLMTRHRDEQELGRVPTLSAGQYLALLEYRQALRDWPATDGFPAAATRPSAPLWLALEG